MSEWFAFHGRTLSGTPQLAERWKRAVGATNAALGDAVGRLYVKHHFSPDTKAQVQALVANVVAAFGKADRAARLDVTGDEGQGKEKLSTLCASAWEYFETVDRLLGAGGRARRRARECRAG